MTDSPFEIFQLPECEDDRDERCVRFLVRVDRDWLVDTLTSQAVGDLAAAIARGAVRPSDLDDGSKDETSG